MHRQTEIHRNRDQPHGKITSSNPTLLNTVVLIVGFFMTGSSLLSGSETNTPGKPKPGAAKRVEHPESGRPELIDEEIAIDRIDRGHWAYRTITDTPPPDTGESDWPRTTIDQYILSILQSQSLSPVAEGGSTHSDSKIKF